MKTIKIGRNNYEIKKGDYVLFNGACYQFCAGDRRGLKWVGYTNHNYLVIPKIRLKEIDFKNMRKVKTGNKEDNTLLIRWYF